jgi:hypothetical protein
MSSIISSDFFDRDVADSSQQEEEEEEDNQIQEDDQSQAGFLQDSEDEEDPQSDQNAPPSRFVSNPTSAEVREYAEYLIKKFNLNNFGAEHIRETVLVSCEGGKIGYFDNLPITDPDRSYSPHPLPPCSTTLKSPVGRAAFERW